MTTKLCFAVMLVCSSLASAITLSTDGKTDYVIVVPSDAILAEQTAARELADHLHQVTGATFPIQNDKAPRPAHRILVGQAIPEHESPGLDGIIDKTSGDDLILTGPRPRGTLYAVDTFLEDQVGVRWWTSTENFIPHRPTLDVGAIDVHYAPPFRYREVFNEDVINTKALFASRLKLNGHMTDIPQNLGGHYTLLGWCHTSFALLPPSEYFAAHPEWYAQINGKRQAGTQLCLTNPDMQSEMVRRALRWIRKNPNAGIISISQNDCGGPCQCEKCQAIVKDEGSESGPWIHFVNAVASDIAKKYPDFLVETLAYQFTRTPPRHVKPANNVLVRLCSIECDFAHPLSGASNAGFGNDLRGWSAIAPNLFIWNYVTSFTDYLIPHPNMTPFSDDLKFFQQNHVVGIFEQGDAFNRGVGDFLPLRAWLLAHLLWDPSRDQKTLRNEFLSGYYGAAGPYLGEYLDLVNSAADLHGFRLGCYNGDTSFLSADDLVKANDLFDRAAKAVENTPDLLHRVQRERLELDHVMLLRYNIGAQLSKARKKSPTTREAAKIVCADYDSKAEAFIRSAKSNGVVSFSEGQSFDSYAPSLLARCQTLMPPDIPAAGAKLLPGSYDIQETQFTLFGKGDWSTLVDDPKASDGKAAQMPGHHTQWAVQFHIPKDAPFTGKGPWKCYVLVRCDAKQKVGAAFLFGLFNPSTGAVAHSPVGFEIAGDDQYHPYPIFVNELHAGEYFWISPPGNGQTVQHVYVDRIYITKGDAK
jgi:hypothetical protein